VVEHLVAKDGVGNLRRVHEVHLQQARLEVRLLRLVVLERIKKEGRRGLNHVLRHEDVHDSLNIDERTLFAVDELRRKLGALVRVRAHDVLQQADVVRGVANLLRVEYNLVRLAGLGEARNHLVRDVCAEVDTEREGHVVQAHNVTKLLATCQLVLLEPLLEELLAALLENRARKLKRLEVVELALLEQDAEVLQNGRQATRGRRCLLERLDDRRSAQDAPRRVGGNLGGLAELAGGEQLLVPFLFTPMMPFVASCSAVTKIVSPEIRFM
jgi:hypothetical protein